ncbi:MAG: DUF434 domain-containing protein [Thermofilaceae archaeon]
MRYYSKPNPIRIHLTRRLLEAGVDFLYLLERGYNRDAALNVVTARWNLSRLERLVLYRGVFDRSTSHERASKHLQNPSSLAIDGFNVLSTVQSALVGDSLILATDGFVRDLSATVRKVRVSPVLASALSLMLHYIARLGAHEVFIVFDAQVSRSGELSRLTQELMRNFNLKGSSITSSKADSFLISCSGEYAVATSDSLLLDSVARAIDLGGLISCHIAEENIINLKILIEEGVRRVAESIAERARTYDEKTGDES